MKIVRASKENLTELAVLFKGYMEYHRRIDGYFACKKNISDLWMKYMKSVLQDKNQIVYQALIDDKIVGYMTARIRSRPPVYETERVGLIGDAYVLPEYRRQRIFTQLLEKVFDWMRKKEVEYVEHPVASQNKLGLEAWRRSGFEDFMIFMRKKINITH